MDFNKIFYIILVSTLLMSCGVGRKLKKADAFYNAGGYYRAAKMYPKVANKIKKDRDLKAETYFKAADSYKRISSAVMAERYYDMAIRYKIKDAEAYLYSAQMALMNEKLDKAEKQIDIFLEIEPNNTKGIRIKESIAFIKKNELVEKPYKIENLRVFNTRYHDFAPTYAASDYETFYFTSTRREGKKKKKEHKVTGESNADIYVSRKTLKGWEKPEPLKDAVNEEDEEGAAVFNSAYDMMFYTKCIEEKNTDLGCDIYAIKYSNGAWGEPEELRLVDSTLVAAHPALSEDGLTMYFSSNIKGGMGSLDLWRVTRASETDLLWSEPINMGSIINTAGNEMYPSVKHDTLYFASDGHVGFGGLDIFKAYTNASGVWKVENMGKPINSNTDDFAIIFEKDNYLGYFSSRRKGGRGGDDIYSFQSDIPVIEFYLVGNVRDEKTNAKLDKAQLQLIGSDGTSIKKTGTKEDFSFRLTKNSEYFLTVTREGYFAQKTPVINTEGLKASKEFKMSIPMKPYTEMVEIPNIFFEFAKSNLTQQSTQALDILIGIMNDNPTIVVELRAHTDNIGSDESNMILSDRRAKAVIDYLVLNGVDEERMRARGLGESEPRIVSEEIAKQHSFMKANQKLDEDFIKTLPKEHQDICHALNRRTEIQVVSDRYKSNEF